MNTISDMDSASRHATCDVAARADVVVVGGGPAGHGGGDRGGAQRRRRDPARALQPPRRPRLGRHGAGARRHVGQPPARDLGARHLPELIERMAAREPGGVPAPGRMGRRSGGASQRWTRWGTFDFHSQEKPHPIVLRRRLRSRRAEARRARDGRAAAASSCACIRGSRARWSRTARSRAWSATRKSGREAILGRRRHRRHRRPRRRRFGRRAAYRRHLHR